MVKTEGKIDGKANLAMIEVNHDTIHIHWGLQSEGFNAISRQPDHKNTSFQVYFSANPSIFSILKVLLT